MGKKLNKLIKFIKTHQTILFLFCIITINLILVLNIYNTEQTNKNIFRLHVVANSNTVSDQIVKLKVNSTLQPYINEITKNCNNTQEIYSKLNEYKTEILNISDNILSQNNKDYSSNINLGIINYEKKESQEIDFKAGNYNSLQLVLGKGNGKNIWSLIMPNETNIEKITCYNTIMPNIQNLFYSTNNKTSQKIQYKSLIFKKFNK